MISTFGLGLALNAVYERIELQPDRSTTATFDALVDQVAHLIDSGQNLRSVVDGWQKDEGAFHLEVIAEDAIQLPQQLIQYVKDGQLLTLENEDAISYYKYLINNKKYLVLRQIPINLESQSSLLLYLLSGVFYLLLVFLVLLWLYPLLRRLLILKQSATKIGRGELTHRVPTSSFSYIADIEREFNLMAQRIEDLVSDVKFLSSTLSHELRSPIAKLRFGVDVLMDADESMERRASELKISNTVDEMAVLVDVLLNYARLDSTLMTLSKKELNLANLCRKELDKVDGGEIAINFTSEPDAIFLLGEEKFLAVLIHNLLGNALKYAKSQVWLSLTAKKEEVYIIVEDDGPGVPAAIATTLFKPFVRGTMQGQGYGLGLAIVQRIADWHGGKVVYEQSKSLQGARFSVGLQCISHHKPFLSNT